MLGAGLAGRARPGRRAAHRPPGDEVAVAAALGGMADAVVVSGVAEAAAALAHLQATDGGRAGLLVTGGLPPVPRDGWPELPAGAALGAGRWSRRRRSCSPALARALERVAVVPDLDAAVDAGRAPTPGSAPSPPPATCVGADWAVGGQRDAPSGLEVRARVDEAEAELRRGRRAGRRARRRARRGRAEAARARSADVDTRAGRPAGRRPHAGPPWPPSSPSSGPPRAPPPRRPSGTSPPGCGPSRPLEQAAVAARPRSSSGWPTPRRRRSRRSRSTEERDRLRAEVAAARQGETEARLAVRTAEERARALHGRAESLRRQARQERAARERAAAARVARERGAAVAAGVRAGAERGARRARPPRWPARPPSGTRSPPPAARREAELLEVRARVRAATAELDRLTDEVHRDEVARAEQRYRIEALEARAAEEYGVDLPTLLAEYGPARRAADPQQSPRPRRRGAEPDPCPTTAPSRSAARPRPSATWPRSARSTRWRWRSSRRSRSGTASWPPSSRTSSPPGATC